MALAMAAGAKTARLMATVAMAVFDDGNGSQRRWRWRWQITGVMLTAPISVCRAPGVICQNVRPFPELCGPTEARGMVLLAPREAREGNGPFRAEFPGRLDEWYGINRHVDRTLEVCGNTDVYRSVLPCVLIVVFYRFGLDMYLLIICTV